MPDLERSCAQYRQLLRRCGQDHLLAFWPRLEAAQRGQLLADLDQIDFQRCQALIETHVRNRPAFAAPQRLEPAPVLPTRPEDHQEDLYRRAEQCGRSAIRRGQVAAFTVAGGMGTRLGHDGPKGAFPISPVRSAPLFQLFAESLLGVERRYGFRPRWYLMTSPANHEATEAFFRENEYFGLSVDDVTLFRQGVMPAFHADGKIALAEPHRVALSPDGHGGSLLALARSGALADMQARGVETVSYFQVDNPLVKVIDPLFIGLHTLKEAEISSKAVTKAGDTERVGNFCLADGQLTIVEYSDLPAELAHARNPDGGRRFDAGNVAIHLLSRRFVERLTSGAMATRLPWHRAEKQVATIPADGGGSAPTTTSVVKLETFVFDALPLSRNPLVVYTSRDEEFSPVKNATGVDSAATARRDLLRRAARWLESCGGKVPRDAAGEPDLPIEISPAFALDEQDLRERLAPAPQLEPRQALLLA